MARFRNRSRRRRSYGRRNRPMKRYSSRRSSRRRRRLSTYSVSRGGIRL